MTLVFQQHAVLECNLDQAIGAFCGEMGCDLWDRRIWEKHFGDNMVIVCTAEVLAQCLMHSFIALDQINLLIFDEAHHAKKNHPYARCVVQTVLLAHVNPLQDNQRLLHTSNGSNEAAQNIWDDCISRRRQARCSGSS